MNHRAVLDRLVAWAEADENIRAVVLTGSVARDPDAVDEDADLDIELYVTDPAPLLQDDAWYHQFGEVLVVEALENPGWHPTRLVYYADGKIDFMIAAVAVLTEAVDYDRPFRLLIDKDGLGRAFRFISGPGSRPPTPAEFLECVHWFHAAIIMWAKYLKRDDPWSARHRDWESKTVLLTMLEWDHKARKGWEYDTWYLGAHLREWVDPDLLDDIAACWSGFGREESVRALRASLDLFELLSSRTAAALGWVPFDVTGVRRRVEHLVRDISPA
jgi:aminoglycoside 6-adenylyltransferase